MRKNHRNILLVIITIITMIGGAFILARRDFAVLSPAGEIASQQRNLILFACTLMLLIVIPVFSLTFYIAWKYRATNTKATYHPEWDHNFRLEALWWGIPCAIILVLAVIAWNSSHTLDPYRALQSDKKPLTIQVVALQWKWLFIYPEQQIASVNYVEFPADTPINFQITADAPMNSFWIPQLGGQVYAMSGMSTKLHLMAYKPGSYQGSSANLSGKGFADMTFRARSSTEADFDTWVRTAKTSSYSNLSLSNYNELAQPSILRQPRQYASFERDLYDTVVMKYMPTHTKKKVTETDTQNNVSSDTSEGTVDKTMERMYHE